MAMLIKIKKFLSTCVLDVKEFKVMSLKKRRNYKLQETLLKEDLEHDEIYEDTREARENECLPYVKSDLYSTAFCYARYTMGMEELSGFGMKNSLTLPSLAIKYLNSLRDENDELIYTCTDPFMRKFVRNAIKALDVMLLINIINLKFRLKCLTLTVTYVIF